MSAICRIPGSPANMCLRCGASLPTNAKPIHRWIRLALVVLTLTEFGILRTLMERPGKVCSRDHLMNTAYELHKIVSDRTIDSHVRRVRAKFTALGADPVETLHGVGYRLGPCE